MAKIEKPITDKKVRIALIGCSGRGSSLLGNVLQIEGVEVPAVCDLVPERVDKGIKITKEALGESYPVHGYTDYKEMLEKENIDGVVIATTWITHTPIAIDCMNKGIHVAMEVGGAASIEECWDIIRTHKKTGKMCMLLENCCYDRKEMAIFNMVKQGLFGELVHLEGGYRHDLRDEISLGRENIHGRLYNFMNRNGELYPTHQLGPISKLLNINRGNRFVTLNSVASKSVGLNVWLKEKMGEDYDIADYKFAQGDVTTTILKTAHGETVVLFHDCSLPRPYSRNFTVQGTKAIFQELSDDDSYIYFDSNGNHTFEPFSKYIEEYEHPLWKWYREAGVKAGHGGMDYLVLNAFVESVKNGTKPPIDIYDTATWMAVTCLSEQSVAMGGQTVPFPDFTNGKWIDREDYDIDAFCLNEIVEISK